MDRLAALAGKVDPAQIGLALAVALVLALVAIQLLDALLKPSPERILAARIEALLATPEAEAAVRRRDAEAIFAAEARGWRGAAAAAAGRIAGPIGGARALRGLALAAFGVGGATALAGSASGLMGGPTAAALGLGAGGAFFALAHGELSRRWRISFLDQLVEAVDMLTRSVRAGYGAPAAIRMVGREFGAPVGPVFARIADEEDLGLPLREALRGAARRIGLPDFSFLVVAMIIQRETGGQIGDSLHNLHTMLRQRKEARQKIRAVTAEGRASAVIVGAIPLIAGAGVYAINPEQTALLFKPGLGQTMLAAAGGLWLTGLLIVRWLVTARP
mgnify:CR=1 FL=1